MVEFDDLRFKMDTMDRFISRVTERQKPDEDLVAVAKALVEILRRGSGAEIEEAFSLCEEKFAEV